MSESILRDKSKVFAKDIVFLCRKLKQNGVESALPRSASRRVPLYQVNPREDLEECAECL